MCQFASFLALALTARRKIVWQAYSMLLPAARQSRL
jgi:hypothetical protein